MREKERDMLENTRVKAIAVGLIAGSTLGFGVIDATADKAGAHERAGWSKWHRVGWYPNKHDQVRTKHVNGKTKCDFRHHDRYDHTIPVIESWGACVDTKEG